MIAIAELGSIKFVKNAKNFLLKIFSFLTDYRDRPSTVLGRENINKIHLKFLENRQIFIVINFHHLVRSKIVNIIQIQPGDLD